VGVEMNERIDKLLVEAGAYFGGEGVVYDTFDPKKFAELIVKECADLCVDNVVDEICGGKRLSAKIKKHFGVEE
jgi:hypothetical protein